ncbi:hypothetical protein EGW08_006290 [Elysia chlorotica]|uniref:Uncharacterized protein n=1 Tax=Elysia chlorotica TaxID=188477 RepID=A0A3S1BQ07_ELYCH|nr:hypothetical protein EGW08_006290 [Elysia chlorotica]
MAVRAMARDRAVKHGDPSSPCIRGKQGGLSRRRYWLFEIPSEHQTLVCWCGRALRGTSAISSPRSRILVIVKVSEDGHVRAIVILRVGAMMTMVRCNHSLTLTRPGPHLSTLTSGCLHGLERLQSRFFYIPLGILLWAGQHAGIDTAGMSTHHAVAWHITAEQVSNVSLGQVPLELPRATHSLGRTSEMTEEGSFLTRKEPLQ